MSRVDWRKINVDDIQYDWLELKNMLLPVLRKKEIEGIGDAKKWSNTILTNCREKLSQLLPFRKNEIEFLDHLLQLKRDY